jgi:DNA sulfur modification protein DndC
MLKDIRLVDYTSLLSNITKQYLADKIPWIIGYSGGKDSTTVLQMVFDSISSIPYKKRKKEIHVISNDTLVENPAIKKYVSKQLRMIQKAGKLKLYKHNPKLFHVKKVTPRLEDTFWVNLIGKGYPSPNRWFRWCTERLKINPTSNYIIKTSKNNDKVIIVLGTRKAESANRASSMKKYDNGKNLRKHTLPNAFVYAPIADMSNDDVWAYLLQSKNPWGSDNMDLLRLYQHACAGGECPLVIETGTQSCGKSRFGCWVCTVVPKDISMEHFVNNGGAWMRDLLLFRNWLHDIRQQSYQYIPNRLLTREIKFSAFLLRTRENILKRLQRMEKKLPIKLLSANEQKYIFKLLEAESKGKVKRGMKRFIYKIPNGKKISVISDYDILKTPRKRLGPLHLMSGKLIKECEVSNKYLKSTRVLYYEVKP